MIQKFNYEIHDVHLPVISNVSKSSSCNTFPLSYETVFSVLFLCTFILIALPLSLVLPAPLLPMPRRQNQNIYACYKIANKNSFIETKQIKNYLLQDLFSQVSKLIHIL